VPRRSNRRTGVAAILAGVLIFAGHGGELLFGSPSDLVDGLFVGLWSVGIVALAVALWGLRDLITGSRVARIGMRVALVGLGFLGLFAIQVAIELIRTGEIPENFILFAIGFLLLLVGQLLFARDLRAALGHGWLLPIAAVVGLVVALGAGDNPVHDVGLLVFEAAWVALGLAVLRATSRSERSLDAPYGPRG
jgi:hypothetical protein